MLPIWKQNFIIQCKLLAELPWTQNQCRYWGCWRALCCFESSRRKHWADLFQYHWGEIGADKQKLLLSPGEQEPITPVSALQTLLWCLGCVCTTLTSGNVNKESYLQGLVQHTLFQDVYHPNSESRGLQRGAQKWGGSVGVAGLRAPSKEHTSWEIQHDFQVMDQFV